MSEKQGNKRDYFNEFREALKWDNYRESTIDTYSCFVWQFLEAMTMKGIYHSRIGHTHVKEYAKGYAFTSRSQQNQMISAIKLLCEKVFKFDFDKLDISRPRKEKHLPKIVDHSEIISKIELIANKKHKAIISLAYSDGFRISEIVNLKIEDIDSVRMQITIRQSKGAKDRIVPLSEKMLELLREYFKVYRPKIWLFNGQNGGKYSKTSCRNIVKKYIGVEMRFHDLRHSCFTYLADQDTPLYKIQKLAGHSNSKTTEIYIHLSNQSLKDLPLPI